MTTSRDSLKLNLSDENSVIQKNENIVNEQLRLEKKIKTEVKNVKDKVGPIRKTPKNPYEINSDHEKEIRKDKEFIKTMTSVYEGLILTNKTELKNLQQMLDNEN